MQVPGRKTGIYEQQRYNYMTPMNNSLISNGHDKNTETSTVLVRYFPISTDCVFGSLRTITMQQHLFTVVTVCMEAPL